MPSGSSTERRLEEKAIEAAKRAVREEFPQQVERILRGEGADEYWLVQVAVRATLQVIEREAQLADRLAEAAKAFLKAYCHPDLLVPEGAEDELDRTESELRAALASLSPKEGEK